MYTFPVFAINVIALAYGEVNGIVFDEFIVYWIEIFFGIYFLFMDFVIY